MPTLPQKHLIALPDGDVEYALAGEGPAIVLVNGAGGPLEGWFRVWPGLNGLGRVLAYNRPGLGRSPRPMSAQHGTAMVAALRALLQAVSLAPPYVLVGHSLGGLLVNLYARHHPAEVAGVLLLESTAPDDVAAMAELETPLLRTLHRVVERLSPRDPLGEVAQLPQTLAELVAAPAFPPIPLTVLSGTKPPRLGGGAAFAVRGRHQAALASLSPLSVQRLATRSGHFPQLNEPELVVREVAALLERVRVGR